MSVSLNAFAADHKTNSRLKSGAIAIFAPSLVFVGGFAVAYFLLHPMLGSGFAIVDDWWIVSWLGGDDHLPFSRIIPTLLSTEVGDLGGGSRFRPVFVFWLIVESCLFGNDALGYHLIRLLIFGGFLASVGWLASRIFPVVVAAALMMWVATPSFWGNLWTLSFGPAEQIAVFGVTLLIVAYGNLVPALLSGKERTVWFHLAGVGTLIAAGSKENFAFLILPYVLVLVILLQRRNLGWFSRVVPFVYLTVPLLVVYALYAASRHGTDFYGEDSSISHRLASIVDNQTYWRGIEVVLFGMLALIAVYHRRLAQRRYLATGIVIAGLAVTYLLWEIFFYNGRLPAGIRYDFPSALLLPLAAGALGGGVLFEYQASHASGRWRWPIQIGTAIAIAALMPRPAFDLPVRAAVSKSVERRGRMTEDLAVLRHAALVHPDWPIAIEANRPWDYEPINTIGYWLTSVGVKNQLYLMIQIPTDQINKPFEHTLVDAMSNWSTEGLPGKYEPQAGMHDAIARAGGCYVISFWDPPSMKECVVLPFYPGHYIPS